MATLSTIRKQIAALEKKAQDLIKKESAQAVAKVREIITKYGLTAKDLGLGDKAPTKSRSAAPVGKARKASRQKVPGAPLYRDPDTGKTWTGRGKPPTWIAGSADRTQFLITGQDESAASAKPDRASKRSKTKSRAPVVEEARNPTKKQAARKSSKASPLSRKTTARSSGKGASSRKATAKKATEPASATESAGESSAA
jgi:DNA-binding protein H-NS